MVKNTSIAEYRFEIEYYLFHEGDNLIVYYPSLDISTSGKDYGDAVKNFYEQFQIYVETCLEMGTLWDDLKDLGRRWFAFSQMEMPADELTGKI